MSVSLEVGGTSSDVPGEGPLFPPLQFPGISRAISRPQPAQTTLLVRAKFTRLQDGACGKRGPRSGPSLATASDVALAVTVSLSQPVTRSE